MDSDHTSQTSTDADGAGAHRSHRHFLNTHHPRHRRVHRDYGPDGEDWSRDQVTTALTDTSHVQKAEPFGRKSEEKRLEYDRERRENSQREKAEADDKQTERNCKVTKIAIERVYKNYATK